jgi:spermidine synthase
MSWFEEGLHPHWRQAFRVRRELLRETTGHQELVIFESEGFGRVLALDGVIQLTEGDEFVYHEMLAHVPILAHGAVRTACVIGGGDGGMAREILKHAGVESCTIVEIDAGVVELCRTHMPTVSAGAWDDPRTRLIIADGIAFMAEAGPGYDLIVIDSTDPAGPGEALFTEAFYGDCARRLAPGGILVNQNGVPFVQPGEISLTLARRRPHFADVGFFLAAVPTYVGGFMALGWASGRPELRAQSVQTIRDRFAAAPFAARYWTPELHAASFALPQFILNLVAGRDSET